MPNRFSAYQPAIDVLTSRIKQRGKNYFLDESERQKWINELISGISTQTQQAVLSEEEALVREGASAATRSATRRGVQQRGQEAQKKGITAMEQFAQSFNQRGQALLDEYLMAEKTLKSQEDLAKFQAIMKTFSDLGASFAFLNPFGWGE